MSEVNEVDGVVIRKFCKGMTVRQRATETRYDYAKITCVHGNGALDVVDLNTGKKYGWSERICEIVCTYPECNCPFDMGSDGKCLRGYCV